jgi:hypothetical protein
MPLSSTQTRMRFSCFSSQIDDLRRNAFRAKFDGVAYEVANDLHEHRMMAEDAVTRALDLDAGFALAKFVINLREGVFENVFKANGAKAPSRRT